MTYKEDQLRAIFQRTSGYCHICHKKVAFKNYGKFKARGAWEVEHSNPRAKSGTNQLNNLLPACISCNRSEGTSSTRSIRAEKGKTRAPLSLERRKIARLLNAFLGGVAGVVVGSLFGPWGRVIGLFIGASIGHKKNPDKM